MEQPSVVVMGGINIDLVTLTPRFPQAGETVVGTHFLTYPGGKGANQAVAAARMGGSMKMIGRIGGDTFGAQLLESLVRSRVDVSGVNVDEDASSGIAVINIDGDAQNRIIQILGANARCDHIQAEAAQKAMKSASVLMLQLEVPLEVSLAVAEDAAAAGKIVILDPGPAQSLPPEMYQATIYLTPNETEAEFLVGFPVTDADSASRAAHVLLDLGIQHVIIKMGKLGAYYASSEKGRFIAAHKVEAIDSVAAGDAFNGALAVALAEGRIPDDAVDRAMAAGALAVTCHGAQDSMPLLEDVEAFLAARS